MKLIVGLGNPGEKYAKNRHNIGFMFADALLEYLRDEHQSEIKYEQNFDSIFSKLKIKDLELIVSKPQTFMNRSGVAVSGVMRFYKVKPEDVYVAHDDLDIPLGKYKIQIANGPKLHNGISSIEALIGTKDFSRVRLGVENRGENRMPGEAYVLSNFTEEEQQVVNDVISSAARDLTKRLI